MHGGHTGATHEYSLDNHSKDFLRIDLASPDAKWEKLPVETLSQGFGMVTHGGLIYQIGGSQATNEKGEPSNLRSIAKCSIFNPKTNFSISNFKPSSKSKFKVASIQSIIL